MTGSLPLDSRSDEVQELLSARPPWLVRWGISAVSLCVIALLGCTWMIRYPDVLQGRVVITARRPPVPVVARTSGRIVRLAVKDADLVETGALLGVIENPADAGEVLALAEQLRAVDLTALVTASGPPLAMRAWLQLGELQAPYSGFARDYGDLLHFRAVDFPARKAASISAQIQETARAQQGLARQQQLAARRITLLEAEYQRSQELSRQGLLSQSELQRAELAYLESRSAAQDVEARIAASQAQSADYRGRLLDLQQVVGQTALDRELAARESFKQLLAALAAWEDKYALKAPIRGRVCFGQFWADNQFVKLNDEVMTIAPESGALVGRVSLPRSGAGKAGPGQRVLVRLDDYPYQEFGMLEGVVDSLAGVSRENAYAADVSFPTGLATSYGKSIPPRPELHGSAAVVTDEVRLLSRLLRPLRQLASQAH